MEIVKREKLSPNIIYDYPDLFGQIAPFNNWRGYKVYYVTDLHLERIQNKRSGTYDYRKIEQMLRTMIDNSDVNLKDIILIGGDVASDVELVEFAYKKIVFYLKYKEYKRLRRYYSPVEYSTNYTFDEDYVNSTFRKAYIVVVSYYLEEYDKEVRWLSRYIDMDKASMFFKKHRGYKNTKTGKYFKNVIDMFLNHDKAFNFFCTENKIKMPSFSEYHLDRLKKINDIVLKYPVDLEINDEFIDENLDNSVFADDFEEILFDDCDDSCYIAEDDEKKITDSLEVENLYAILGNHELISFRTVEQAVEYYSGVLKKYNIHFLHNSYKDINCSIRIVGGIGFAKLDPIYNCERIWTTVPPMTLEEEARQTDLFEEAYFNSIYDKSSGNDIKHIIVLSHYPIRSWLDHTNSNCTYFYGHDHKNYKKHTENVDIYADNQRGYKGELRLKSCTLGIIKNPYSDYKDGYHEVSVKSYEEFCDYTNESCGMGNVKRVLKIPGTKFYMVKKNGFYAFFLIRNIYNEKKAFICQGGRVTQISNIVDINYYYSKLDEVVYRYIEAIRPIREVQNKISNELKKIGLDGRIHGLIVDIDWYSHIMVNVGSDIKLTYYYSPIFGEAKKYNSFLELAMDSRTEIPADIVEKIKCLSANGEKENILIQNKHALYKESKMEKGLRKDPMYKISRDISKFQRLFSGRTLREWPRNLR